MVPATRFELVTFGLQNRCTTTVLSRHQTYVNLQISLGIILIFVWLSSILFINLLSFCVIYSGIIHFLSVIRRKVLFFS